MSRFKGVYPVKKTAAGEGSKDGAKERCRDGSDKYPDRLMQVLMSFKDRDSSAPKNYTAKPLETQLAPQDRLFLLFGDDACKAKQSVQDRPGVWRTAGNIQVDGQV